MSAVATAGTAAWPRWWLACERGPDTCPGREAAMDTSMATDASLATCAGHQPVRTVVVPEAADGQSADRSLITGKGL